MTPLFLSFFCNLSTYGTSSFMPLFAIFFFLDKNILGLQAFEGVLLCVVFFLVRILWTYKLLRVTYCVLFFFLIKFDIQGILQLIIIWMGWRRECSFSGIFFFIILKEKVICLFENFWMTLFWAGNVFILLIDKFLI